MIFPPHVVKDIKEIEAKELIRFQSNGELVWAIGGTDEQGKTKYLFTVSPWRGRKAGYCFAVSKTSLPVISYGAGYRIEPSLDPKFVSTRSVDFSEYPGTIISFGAKSLLTATQIDDSDSIYLDLSNGILSRVDTPDIAIFAKWRLWLDQPDRIAEESELGAPIVNYETEKPQKT